jgi:hypothetical protein
MKALQITAYGANDVAIISTDAPSQKHKLIGRSVQTRRYFEAPQF